MYTTLHIIYARYTYMQLNYLMLVYWKSWLMGRNPVSKRSEKFKAEKSEKNEKKAKKYTLISLRFVSLRSENYSSEAKRKIWSENKRKEAKKEKWNFIVK